MRMAPKKTRAPKEKSKPKQPAFYWTNALSKTLVELILSYQESVGREKPMAWKKFKVDFEGLTGKKCNSFTLKNRNRDMKAEWIKWKTLKHGETGLGWDTAKGTIAASDEWWDKKLKSHPEFNRFRKKGVPSDLEELWTQLYDGAITTEKYCVVPSMDASKRLGDYETSDALDDGGKEGDEGDNGSQVNPLLSGGTYIEGLDETFPSHPVHVTPTPCGDGVGDSTGATHPNGTTHTPSPPPARVSGIALGEGHLNKGKRLAGSASTSTQGPGKQSVHRSEGSRLFQQHIEVAQETNSLIRSLLEKDKVLSLKPGSITVDALTIVQELVRDSLLLEGEPLWCFTVSLIASHLEQRDVFMNLNNNNARLKWLKWVYEMEGGRIIIPKR